MAPEKEEEELDIMRGVYGLLAGLAMVLATGVYAADTPAKGTFLAGGKPALAAKAHVPVAAPTAAQRVEAYFNGIDTLQAAFTQTVTGEKRASKGMFFWQRPGRFLWQYNTPERQKVVSTGSGIYYHNEDTRQTTQLPTNAGMARLFNAKTMNLAKQGLKVVDARETGGSFVVVFGVDKKIAMTDNSGLQTLTLTFDKVAGNKLQISQIDAVDTLNTTTHVEFADVKENVALVKGLFSFTPGVYEQRN